MREKFRHKLKGRQINTPHMFLGVRRRQTQKNNIRRMKIGKRAHALELVVGIHGMPLGRKPPPQLIANHAERYDADRVFFVRYVPHYMFATEKAEGTRRSRPAPPSFLPYIRREANQTRHQYQLNALSERRIPRHAHRRAYLSS